MRVSICRPLCRVKGQGTCQKPCDEPRECYRTTRTTSCVSTLGFICLTHKMVA